MLLALALCLVPQTPGTTATRVTAPAAPTAPTPALLRRIRTWDPVLADTPNGRFHDLELWTADGPETFGLYVPNVPTPSPTGSGTPLLVHFHTYGGGNFELIAFARTMLSEADARGWYLLAPNQDVRNAQGQRDGRTFGNDEAQRRVQATLDWARATLAIDRERIYGYGFSMGGGDVLSYAAQHLDPERGAFAAVINHTGTLVLSEEWTRNSPVRPPLEGVFDGSPAVTRYAYDRASSVEFPWSPTQPGVFTGAGAHTARNLFFTPIRSWYHVNDVAFLRALEFMQALDTLVFDHEIVIVPTLPPPASGPPIPDHAWEYLDPRTACNWFEQQTLTVPSAGTLHVARDARYHDLALRRKTGDDFGAITFDLPVGGSTIQFTGIKNLLRIRIDAARSGLATQIGSLIVNLGRDQHPLFVGRPVILEIANLGFIPSQVIQWNTSQQPTWTVVDGVLLLVSTAPTGATTIDNLEIVR